MTDKATKISIKRVVGAVSIVVLIAIGLPVGVGVHQASAALQPGTKTVDKTTANPGDLLSYTISYSCPGIGAGNCNGSTIVDALPTYTDVYGVVRPLIIDSIGTNTQFTSGVGSDALAVPGIDTVTWTAPTLAFGASGFVTLVLRVPAGAFLAPGPQNLNNTAQFFDAGLNSKGSTNTVSTQVNVGSSAVTISKSDGVTQVPVDGNTTYTIAICPQAAHTQYGGYTVTDTLPIGAVVVNANGGSVVLGSTKGIGVVETTPGNPVGPVNEIQTLSATGGAATGGTYTLTFGADTTGPIAYNANAATIDAALEALPSVNLGSPPSDNVLVTGGPLNTGSVAITFRNALGAQNVGAIVPTTTFADTVVWTIDSTNGTIDPVSGCITRSLKIYLPAAQFPIGSSFTNTVVAKTITNVNVGPATDTDTIRDGVPNIISAKVVTTGGYYVKNGDPLQYGVSFTNNGEKNLTNVTLIDGPLPLGFRLTGVSAGTWPGPLSASIEFSDDNQANWTVLGTSDGTTFTPLNSLSTGLFGMDDATNTGRFVRWVFTGTVPPGFTWTSAGQLVGTVATASLTLPAGMQNCATATGTPPSGPVVSNQACVSTLAETPQPDGFIDKTVSPSKIFPGDSGTYTITVGNGPDATGPLVTQPATPIIVEDCVSKWLLNVTVSPLPAGWTQSAGPPPTCPAGDTALHFEYVGPDLAPGTNAPTITFTFRVSAYGDPLGPAPPQSLDNKASMTHGGVGHCPSGVGLAPPCPDTGTFLVPVTTVLNSQKSVNGELDPAGVFSDSGDTFPGGAATWKLHLLNDGNVDAENVVFIDILPYIGDTGVVVNNENRETQWDRPYLAALITPPPGWKVEYSLTANPCRPEVAPFFSSPCVAPAWTLSPVDITAVRSIRLSLVGLTPTQCVAASQPNTCGTYVPGSPKPFDDKVSMGEEVTFTYETRAPTYNASFGTLLYDPTGSWKHLNPVSEVDNPAGDPQNVALDALYTNCVDMNDPFLSPSAGPLDPTETSGGLPGPRCPVARNSFGYGANAFSLPAPFPSTVHLGSEPPQVDITVYQPPQGLGDFVWRDVNDNGIQDVGETGFAGVRVELYTAVGHNLVAFTYTDANGYYLFTDFPSGDYVVRFYPPNGYLVSPPDAGGAVGDTDFLISPLVDANDSDAPKPAPGNVDPTFGPWTETAAVHISSGELDPRWDLGVWSPSPAVTLVKSTWDTTAGTPATNHDGISVPIGNPVWWTYHAVNTGNTRLINLVLSDNKLGTLASYATGYAAGVSCVKVADGGATTTVLSADLATLFLLPGEGLDCQVPGVAGVVNYSNTGTITGDARRVVSGDVIDLPAYNPTVTATNPSNYTPVLPTISLVKSTWDTTAGTPATNHDGISIPIGNPVWWTYHAVNTGPVRLDQIRLSDDKLGLLVSYATGYAAGVSCVKVAVGGATTTVLNADLATLFLLPGEGLDCQVPGIAGLVSYNNVGTVIGRPTQPNGSSIPGASDVTATNPSSYTPSLPTISLVKSTWDTTAGTASTNQDGISIPIGNAVWWTYHAVNTGPVRLDQIRLSDDKLGLLASYANGYSPGVTCVKVAVGGATTALSNADLATLFLLPGEGLDCKVSGIAGVVNYNNVGTVIGRPTQPNGSSIPGASDVTATNPSSYTPSLPTMSLVKSTWDTTAGTASTNQDGITIATGNTVWWTYHAVNTGPVRLDQVSLSDDKLGVLMSPFGYASGVSCVKVAVGGATTALLNADLATLFLLPGQGLDCKVSGIAGLTNYSNTGTITGRPTQANGSTIPGATNVTATDPSSYNANPEYDLALIKTTATPGPVAPGGAVVWNVTVQNQGRVASGAYSITDTIPAGMTFVSATDGGSAVGQVVTWNLTGLAPGQTRTISVTVTVTDATLRPFRNWAEISADSGNDSDSTPDTDTGNDNAQGFGTLPNDANFGVNGAGGVTNHDDLTFDSNANTPLPGGAHDEDDNDYADIDTNVVYDLSLVKVSTSLSPLASLPVSAGWTVRVTNQGNVPSRAFTVTDTLPAGMAFGSCSASIGSTTCTLGHANAASPLADTVTMTWTPPTTGGLLPGESVDFTLNTTVTDFSKSPFRNWAEVSSDGSAAYGAGVHDKDSTPDTNTGSGGSLPNDASTGNGYVGLSDLGSTAIDQVLGDEDDNDDAVVATSPVYDLALVKTASVSSVAKDGTVTWTVQVVNQGNVPSGVGVEVTDRLPSGMQFTGCSVGVSCVLDVPTTGRVVTVSGLPSLAPGEVFVFTVSSKVTDIGQRPFTNWAEVSKDGSGAYNTHDKDSTPDTNTGSDNGAGGSGQVAPNDLVFNHNNIAVDNMPGVDEDDNDFETVQGLVYDLALIKTSSSPATVGPNDTITWNVTVINQGGVPSGDYSVGDNVPAGLTVVPGSVSDGGSVASGVVTWDVTTSLAPGESKVLTFETTVSDTSLRPFRNWAEITKDSGDDNDSTPNSEEVGGTIGSDSVVGDGSGAGDPNDAFVNHNDPNFNNNTDTPLPGGNPADEDDNDFEQVTVNVVYDLSLVKVALTTSPVTLGDTVTWRVRVQNQGNVPSGVFSVSDMIPAGLSLVGSCGPTPTAVTASLAGTLTCSYSAPALSITWPGSGDGLLPGEAVDFTFQTTVTDLSMAPYRNWAGISGDSGRLLYGVTDVDSTPNGTNGGSDQVPGVGTPTSDPYAGLEDLGSASVNNVVGDEDDSDDAIVAANPVYDLALVKTASPSAVAKDGTITWTIQVANQGNVPSGLGVEVTDTLPSGTEFSGCSAGLTCTPDGGNPLIVTVSGLPSLAPGDVFVFTVSSKVTDIGQRPFTNWAEISKTDSVALYGVGDKDSTPDTNTGSDAGPGGSGQSAPNDLVLNHNNIAVDNMPGVDEDDNDYETVQGLIYDLALIKTTSSAATVGPNDTITWHVTVINQGDVASGNYSVGDNVPAGLVVVPGSISNGGTVSSGVVTWDLTGLEPGTQVTLTFETTVSDTSLRPFRNWAEITKDSGDDNDSTPNSEEVGGTIGSDSVVGDGSGAGDPNDAFVNHNDPNFNNNTDTPLPNGNPADEDDNDFEQVTVNVVYDLSLAKVSTSLSPLASLPVSAGWTVRVTNQGNVPSRAFTVTDTLPAGMAFGSCSASIGSTTCTLGHANAASPLADTVTMTWTPPTTGGLLPGESVDFTLNTTVTDFSKSPFRNWAEVSSDGSAFYNTQDKDSTPDTNTGSGGSLPNDAYVGLSDLGSTAIDQVLGDEDDNDDAVVATSPVYDLALVKTASVSSVAKDGTVTWTVQVVNQGNVPSGVGVEVTDRLPSGMQFTGCSVGVSCVLDVPTTGRVVTVSGLPSLAPGEVFVFTVSSKVTDIGQRPFTNWAEVSKDGSGAYNTHDKDSTPDTNTGSDNGAGGSGQVAPNDLVFNHNNIAVDNMPGVDEDDNDFETVQGLVYDLALIKTSSSPATVGPNDTITWNVTVINQGGVPSGDYSVGDNVPAGLTVVPGSVSDGGSVASGVVTWDVTTSLAPGESKVLTFETTVSDTSLRPFRNWAEITKDSGDDNDSTPNSEEVGGTIGSDSVVGDGSGAGDPNDAFVNHNDPNFNNNTDTPLPGGNPADEDDNDFEQVTVNVVYDLSLVKVATTVSPLTPPASAVGWTVRVTNQGNVPSRAFTVTDTLPAGMAFGSCSASIGSTSCTLGHANAAAPLEWTVTMTWSPPTAAGLLPGQSVDFTLNTTVTDFSKGSFRNWAEVSSDGSGVYGTQDKDSTPDTNTGSGGTLPNDASTGNGYVGLTDLGSTTTDQVLGDEDDNDDAIVTTNVVYDLALAKVVDTSGPALPGQDVVWRIRVKNQGTVPSGAFTVTDTIPAGMSLVSCGVTSGSTTCTSGHTNAASPSADTVTMTWTPSASGGLLPGQSVEFIVTTKLPALGDAGLAAALAAGPYRNWAEISADSAQSLYGVSDVDSTPDTNTGSDPGSGINDPKGGSNDAYVANSTLADTDSNNIQGDEDDNDDAVIAADVHYDLALIKTVSASSAKQGDTLVWTIKIANQGNVPSLGYTVTDTLPAGITFVSASAGSVAVAGTPLAGDDQILTITGLPSIDPGKVLTLTITTQVTDITQRPFRNWAEISHDSSSLYGTHDEDSTPDTNTGSDNGPGVGTPPNDDVDNHNNISIDTPLGDEDDNDYEDVSGDLTYDLALVKVVNSTGPVQPGDTVTWTIRVKNQGNVDSKQFTVVDQIPTGTTYVSSSCAPVNSNVSCLEAAGKVTFTVKNLTPGQTVDLTLQSTIGTDAASVNAHPYRNWAEIATDGSSTYGPDVHDKDSTPNADENNGTIGGPDNTTLPNDNYVPINALGQVTTDQFSGDEDDNDDASVDTVPRYDLSLVKTTDVPKVQPTDNIVWHLRAANQGNLNSGEFTVTDQIPTGLGYVADTCTEPTLTTGSSKAVTVTCSESGGIVTFVISNLVPGDYVDLDVTTIITDIFKRSFRNWAEISQDSAGPLYNLTDADSRPDNTTGLDETLPNDSYKPQNSLADALVNQPVSFGDEDDNDDAVVAVDVQYDLALIKTASTGKVKPGETVTWTIRVANQGNVPSLGYQVQDQIPAGMSFVSADNGGQNVNGRVTWDLSNLAPNDFQLLTVVTRLDDPLMRPFYNWAEITKDSSNLYSIPGEVIHDRDSTPDTNIGNDNAQGAGVAPNDTVTNHNDSDFNNDTATPLADSKKDEDDNDYEAVDAQVNYDIALAKIASTTLMQPTDTVTFTVRVANQGLWISGPLTVADNIPEGMAYVAGSASNGGSSASGQVTWDLASLNAGQYIDVTYQAKAVDLTKAPYRNWAEIVTDGAAIYGNDPVFGAIQDEDSTPNSLETSGTIGGPDNTTLPDDPYVSQTLGDALVDNQTPGPQSGQTDSDDNDDALVNVDFHYDLALIKTLKPKQTYQEGGEVIWLLTVVNQGNVPSRQFQVTDTIPTGMGFVSASDGGVETSLGSGIVVWTVPDLAAGSSVQLVLTTRIHVGILPLYRNWAEISSDSATDYPGVLKDEDSTPDANTGHDSTPPNDAVTNHNNPGFDNNTDTPLPKGALDEDDNDYEDVLGPQVAGIDIPVTGANTRPMTWVGFLLLFLGVALTLGARRRRKVWVGSRRV